MSKRKKKDNTKNILIFLLVIIFILSVGLVVLADRYGLGGDYSNHKWKVEIIDLKCTKTKGLATNLSDPIKLSTLGVSLGASLISKGDSVEYKVTIKNNGNIDAILDNVIVDQIENDDSNIKYKISGTSKGNVLLKPSRKKKITIKLYYDKPTADENNAKNIKMNIFFIYKERTNNVD